jgi:hypothetical protein
MNCALCQENPTGQKSHIIPAFIFRWLKKTSATGFMRGTKEPNRRVQDGPKYPLLCGQCEDRLSVFEDEFASEIFHPYAQSKQVGLPYNEVCLKFFTSVAWRVLHHLWITDKDPKPLQPELEGALDKPYDVWRKFLLDQLPHPGRFTIHVIPIDNVTSSTVPNTPLRPSQYNTGAIDMDLVCCESWGHVYVKIPYFFIFGTIFEKRSPKFSMNTLIRLKRGNLGGMNMVMPQNIMEYIHSRSRLIESQREVLTQKQLEGIIKAVERDPKRMVESRSFESAAFDANLNRARPE